MDLKAVGEYADRVIVGEKGVPGVDITVMRDHKLLYRHLSGNASAGGRYFMYSCTKPVTVAAVMRLIEDGLLSLQDPVEKYLPGFSQLFTEKDGQRVPVQRPVTVYHLLTMSAGFDYSLITDPEKNAKLMALAGENAATQELVACFAKFPLEFQPGERFCYSVCHDVLAAVAEAVTGQSFSQYVKTVLFDPLKMEHTTYRHTPQALEQVMPQYLYYEGKLHPMPRSNQHVLTPNYDSGGAGIISSAEDYRRFADMMACGGTAENGYQFLKPETVKLLSQPRLDYPGPAGYRYGLGVRVRCENGEFGWDGAAGSCVMVDPENRISILIAMHVLNWPALIGEDHFVLRDLVYSAFGQRGADAQQIMG